MIRKSILLIALFLLGTTNHDAKPSVARYVDLENGSSFNIPTGWTIEEIPGQNHKIVVGPAKDDFTPSMNVVAAYFTGSLDDYVAANLRILPKVYEGAGRRDFKILNQSDFFTRNKQRAVKVVTQFEMNGRLLRQTGYFFQGQRGTMLLVACSVLSEGGEAFDQVFEDSMMTFNSESNPPRPPAALFEEEKTVVA